MKRYRGGGDEGKGRDYRRELDGRTATFVLSIQGVSAKGAAPSTGKESTQIEKSASNNLHKRGPQHCFHKEEKGGLLKGGEEKREYPMVVRVDKSGARSKGSEGNGSNRGGPVPGIPGVTGQERINPTWR